MFGVPQTVALLRSLPADVCFADVLGHHGGITVETSGELPAEGPLVVAANHPYPILDYYGLAFAVEQRRGGRVRVVVDALSKPMRELHPLLAFVGDSDEERDAFWREQSAFLRDGGAVVIFPAGQTNYRDGEGVAVETPWRGGALKLASLADATLVPAFVRAETSFGYNLLRRLLPRGVVQNLNLREAHTRSATVDVTFGAPLDVAALSTDALRDAVYTVGGVGFRLG
jgi:1-acyl-sn-glycerol-3-phosphate acyltransferase